MEEPFIRVEDTGELFLLRSEITTVGRGRAVDIRLTDPSVSRLHAEIVRRGPYAYIVDLGLSRNGTRVNGRPVARRVLEDGDVVSFGAARCRVGGIPHEDLPPEVELRRSATPELTRRELDVLTSLCRPALSDEAFVAPATAREIAADLVVTEAAVKQHLLRLYQKFRIPEGSNRRTRLANEVVALGLVRPLPSSGGIKPEPARPGVSAGGNTGSAGGLGFGSGGDATGTTGPQGAGPQGAVSRGPASHGASHGPASHGPGPRSTGSKNPTASAESTSAGSASADPPGSRSQGNDAVGEAGAADAGTAEQPPHTAGRRNDSRHIRGADRAPPRSGAVGRNGHTARQRAS